MPKIISGRYCMPCKILHKWVEEKNLSIEEVFTDENEELVEKLGIEQTPTLVLDDGTLVAGLEAIKEHLSEGVN